MPSAAQKTAKKRVKVVSSRSVLTSETPLRGTMLTGDALLNDMRTYSKKVAATPESARDFLTRLGVLDKNGKRRNLIRD